MLLPLLVLLSAVVWVDADGYCYSEPECGPYAWGDLTPSCHPLLEEHHSPIDLDLGDMRRDLSLGPLQLEGFLSPQDGHWTLSNDGHSGLYHTLQLHFHWGSPASNGSEHTLARRRFPMEMHVVNVKSVHPNVSAALEDPTGLAVLAVFIDVVYADNIHFSHISGKLSSVAHKGQTVKVKPFPLMSLLPKNQLSQYFRYHGSLTTPPCSQAVVWTVYQTPINISWTQLAQFTSQVFSTEEDAELLTPLQNNYRHIHPTFSRTVSASQDVHLVSGAAGLHTEPWVTLGLCLLWLFPSGL
uniref:Carbonic anhydrase n=1 Tax=Knipowitschia caucasica TaxID=637954 RepID=A0AAV2IWN3_KNICA